MRYLFILSLLLLLECLNAPKTGVYQRSENIAMAKEIGVYHSEYFIANNPFIKCTSKQYPIQEAWVESFWFYKNNSREIEKYNDKQLVVNLRIDDAANIFEECKCESLPKSVTRGWSNGYQLLFRLSEYPDTIIIICNDLPKTILKLKDEY